MNKNKMKILEIIFLEMEPFLIYLQNTKIVPKNGGREGESSIYMGKMGRFDIGWGMGNGR
jgi:hypothetical protein